jgi:hypothetical protein
VLKEKEERKKGKKWYKCAHVVAGPLGFEPKIGLY